MNWKHILAVLMVACGLLLPVTAAKADEVRFYLSYDYHDRGISHPEYRAKHFYLDHRLHHRYSPALTLRHHANCRHFKNRDYVSKKHRKHEWKHHDSRNRLYDRYYQGGVEYEKHWHH